MRVRNFAAWLIRLWSGPLNGTSTERILRTIPVVIYLTIVYLVSDLSAVEVESVGVTIDDGILHFVEYAVLGVLLLLAAAGFVSISNAPGARWISGLIAFSFAFAVSDEYHQSFVPGRDASLMDVGFDVLGSAAALLIVPRLLRLGER